MLVCLGFGVCCICGQRYTIIMSSLLTLFVCKMFCCGGHVYNVTHVTLGVPTTQTHLAHAKVAPHIDVAAKSPSTRQLVECRRVRYTSLGLY